MNIKWRSEMKVTWLCPTLWPHGLYSSWSSPGQNTGGGSLSFLQGNLPNPGIEPRSPAMQVDSLPTEPQQKLQWICFYSVFIRNIWGFNASHSNILQKHGTIENGNSYSLGFLGGLAVNDPHANGVPGA